MADYKNVGLDPVGAPHAYEKQEVGKRAPPNPINSGRVLGITEARGEKNGVVLAGVPDHLGQTNYAEICRSILVTKYKIYFGTE